jgi:hypothetical protein
MIGAALGRKVWFSQDPHHLWPMLNMLLIGPSGIGKSTGLRLGFELIWGLPREIQPQVISGTSTVEKLHEDLFANPHAMLYASELANFFSRKKYMEDMIPYVTELLDYGPHQERRTKSGGLIVIPEPSVTVVGCSTTEWLQEQLPDSATAGGFLARFLVVHEEHKSKREALPSRALGRAKRFELAEKRTEVMKEFAALVQTPRGEIDFRDFEQSNIYSNWYSTHTAPSGHLAPFSERAGEFVLRMSMLIAISCGRNVILGKDVRAATALYEYIENRLQEVVVPFTPQGKMLSLVLQAIGENSITDKQLCKAMRNFCTAQDAIKYAFSLEQSGDITRTQEGKWKRIRG